MKVILIDDEISSIEILEQKLTNYCTDVEIVGKFQDPYLALRFLQAETVDVVFTDIEMPGLNGFELLTAVNDVEFEVVFITAFNQFAIDAIRIHAFDYLTKPILIEDLQKCVNRLRSYLMQNTKIDTNPFTKIDQQHEKLLVSTSESIDYISIENIIYIKADRGYSILQLVNESTFFVSKSIGDYEESLHTYGFFRPHHSYLVNLKHIQRFLREDGGILVTTNGYKLPVSKRKKDEMLELMRKNSAF
jgi:two-component system LytT family response regulator